MVIHFLCFLENKWALDYGDPLLCFEIKRALVYGNCNIFCLLFREANGLWDIMVIFFILLGNLWDFYYGRSKSSE
jgi:hypothetical protein